MTNNSPSTPPDAREIKFRDSDPFRLEAQGHEFTFYPRGSDRLEALAEHIDKAESSLHVFYYMFQDDQVGTRIRDGLINAAKRGVDVHLIIDDFGSDAPAEFFEPLTDAGGKFSIFSADWNVRYLIRNHQKFVIRDGEQVMTGGSNVSNGYYDPPENNGWCDLGVLIEGEVVEQFARWFVLLRGWTEGSGSQFRRVREMIRNWDPGDKPVQLLIGGPLLRRSHWVFRLKRDLASARRLDLVTAYFGPARGIRRLIAGVARRGKARLITAGVSDIEATIDVARLFYKKLLRAGAEIYEFQPCKLHMKLIVVDDVSYFGSANLDRRSTRINVELMVRVADKELAKQLREFMNGLEDASVRADQEWYRQHSGLWNRLKWRVFYWFTLVDYRMARIAAE